LIDFYSAEEEGLRDVIPFEGSVKQTKKPGETPGLFELLAEEEGV